MPADFTEARWRRLTDADALGTPLSPTDREALEQFVPRSAEARAEAELFGALAGLGRLDEDADDAALVQATLQRARAAQWVVPLERVESEPSPVRTTRWWWAGAGLAAAAAVVVAWVGLRGPTAEPHGPAGESAVAGSTIAEASPSPEVEPEADPPTTIASPDALAGLTVTTGTLVEAAGTTLAEGARARGVLRVESERGCVGLDQATACFGQGSRLEIDADDPTHLVLLEGEGDIEAPAVLARVLTVEIAGDRYAVRQPVTIHTVVHRRDDARVTVVEGRVELVDPQGHTEVLEAGRVREHGRSPLPDRRSSRPEAKELLTRARARRSAGDRAGAITEYETLLRLHPRAPVSRAAMVSLGDLYLETGRPSVALTWFDRYLRRGGSLAQEASLGRIKALGALGRHRQEQEAIEQFRRRYPSSPYAARPGAASKR